MMADKHSKSWAEPDTTALLAGLALVNSLSDFKTWVRRELRFALPHSSFLASVGRLYGIGTVPTHRVSVEFPLTLIEDLKNADGAINDPLAASWFKNGKLRQIQIPRLGMVPSTDQWATLLHLYGFRDMLVHGVIDRRRKLFVTFHVGNIVTSERASAGKLINQLVDEMARTVCNITAFQTPNQPKLTFWHPTLTLTHTEIQIIELIAQGMSNKEIARIRGVSDSTIKTQISRTGAKVGASRRAEIVALVMPMLRSMPMQTLVDYDTN